MNWLINKWIPQYIKHKSNLPNPKKLYSSSHHGSVEIMITTLTRGQISLPIDREIRTRLEKGRADTFLHIVPTDHARVKWCREYLKNTPDRVVAGLHVYTLGDFVGGCMHV